MSMPTHKNKPSCMGKDCPGCPTCMDRGGAVRHEDEDMDRPVHFTTKEHAKGVHRPTMAGSGSSLAGNSVRNASEYKRTASKEDRINDETAGTDEGIHTRQAKIRHGQVLHEMKSMKKPNLYAEGGEVSEDHDLHDAMGSEYMGALERKDRKGIMQAIEAIVLSMKHKE